ncbi:secondary carrier transporter [Lithospermum erythrorhizon]|uniref:Secondary carrier transporter n=1 Tax=Lithospermum erythrorhizon TaxID=34254 RepID=A0AAV3NMA6_LITER
MESQVLIALGLSLLGGLSTSIGALFVVLNQAPNLKMLGLLQGFAAGLMLSISFFDLAHNSINSIGFLKANLWTSVPWFIKISHASQFFAGVIFFGVISGFIPEPTLAPSTDVGNKKKNDDHKRKDDLKKHQRQVMFSGIITAIGISLHNFPEGMAVFLGSVKVVLIVALLQGLRVGVNLALAICLHNIPEGVAVALPVYFATQSKWQAFKLATLSGLAEPLGVIIVGGSAAPFQTYLFPSSLDPEILEGLLGSVGGVMAFLTLHEMLPLAFDYAGQKQAVKAVFLGMAFMSASYNKWQSAIHFVSCRAGKTYDWMKYLFVKL